MKKMEGKVVLITGGARGIGYGVAKAFAEEGANIVITGRTASTLVEARENLEADYGIEALFVVADGGDEEAVKNVVKQAAERFGRLDCLVNNAQVSKIRYHAGRITPKRILTLPFIQAFMQHSFICARRSLT